MNEIKQQDAQEKKSNRSFVALILVCTIVLVLVSLILLETSNNLHADMDDEYELKQVHLLFRHGDRTPDNPTYPLDPYINETYEPYGHGQLTETGYFRMFDNGRFFRKRYKSFLGLMYNQTEVYAQTTAKYRAKLSLQLFAAGMFFPDHAKVAFNPNLNWRPLQYTSPPLDSDPILFPLGKFCSRFIQDFYDNYALVLEENKQLFSNLSNFTDKSFQNAFDIISLTSVLDAQVEYGLPVPAWAEDYYPRIIRKLNNEAWGYFLHDEVLKRIFGGNFLQKLLSDWEENIAQSSPKKLFIYSAHDGTVVGALGAFNVWDTNNAPDYGVTAIFELKRHRQSGVHGVQVYVRNKDHDEPVLLTIPGCQSFCPLHRLKELLGNHIPTASDCD